MSKANHATVNAAALNPSFDECQCELAQKDRDTSEAEALHGWLLGLDGPNALEAMARLHPYLDGAIPPNGYTPQMFIGEHNWTDPVSAVWVGMILRDLYGEQITEERRRRALERSEEAAAA